MTAKLRRDTLEILCLIGLFAGTWLVSGVGWGIIVVAGVVLLASVSGTLRG